MLPDSQTTSTRASARNDEKRKEYLLACLLIFGNKLIFVGCAFEHLRKEGVGGFE